MTNHPRSPRAKFKVGQVVAEDGEYSYKVGRIMTAELSRDKSTWVYYAPSFGWLVEADLRPLTKKEAGR